MEPKPQTTDKKIDKEQLKAIKKAKEKALKTDQIVKK